jgi:hypothetical protein
MLPTPVDKAFQRSFRGMERGGLLVVAAAILWAGGAEVFRLIETQKVGVADLLLLFIYLEMISMVEMYWRRQVAGAFALVYRDGRYCAAHDGGFNVSLALVDAGGWRIDSAVGDSRADRSLRTHEVSLSCG